MTVNGRRANLGDSVGAGDEVRVDGVPLEGNQEHVTLMLHKPRGVVTSARDEYGRRNVLDLVPQIAGLHPVGRLDRDSEGLLILTTDGALTQQLTHPSFEHEKEYRVWTDLEPTRKELQALRQGVDLEDGFAQPKRLEAAMGGAVMVLSEGRNRQVRRMFEAVGLAVVRLQRRRIGDLYLGDLRPREWRELTERDLERLRAPGRRR